MNPALPPVPNHHGTARMVRPAQGGLYNAPRHDDTFDGAAQLVRPTNGRRGQPYFIPVYKGSIVNAASPDTPGTYYASGFPDGVVVSQGDWADGAFQVRWKFVLKAERPAKVRENYAWGFTPVDMKIGGLFNDLWPLPWSNSYLSAYVWVSTILEDFDIQQVTFNEATDLAGNRNLVMTYKYGASRGDQTGGIPLTVSAVRADQRDMPYMPLTTYGQGDTIYGIVGWIDALFGYPSTPGTREAYVEMITQSETNKVSGFTRSV